MVTLQDYGNIEQALLNWQGINSKPNSKSKAMITKSEKIAELQAYLVELKNCKPRLLCTSLEEVDDIYQQMLEWQYEYSSVSDEIKLIETMEQSKFDNYYNPQEPENEEYHKPQYGDIICGDFCEDEY